MLAFRFIWQQVAKEGYIEASELNYPAGSYKATLLPFAGRDAWDDRWSCAGLGEVLIHVARAIIYLSLLWEKNRAAPTYPKGADAAEIRRLKKQEREGNWLRPDRIHDRAVADLSCALGLSEEVVKKLVGSLDECRELQNTKLFPKFVWVVEAGRPSARSPSLWDGLVKK